MRRAVAVSALLLLATIVHAQADGNRLAYLDEVDPYYPHLKFPKLITPQWVGEKGVDAVVILAIDDMREPKKYEAFLRPILRRLQEIDGRAPVSIMTNQVPDPKDPLLQQWLREGLSLECHTYDHPCPFFKNGFAKAKETYDRCVDMMHAIPNNKPVAFRMPCCDSLNTPSPRFYAEIFNKITPSKPEYLCERRWRPLLKGGHYLSIDSSVFNVFTSNDPELPRELVQNPDGTERFLPYLPADRSFVNTIENYPYPYVIGGLCWQFPCMTPSDWEAQHRHKSNNPKTVEDWKAALDCTVIKKGVMTMVFHPHGWIKNDQLVELIDYADKKYGKRVKFLNFREALERLEKNLLSEQPLREEISTWPYDRGVDNGVRLLDVNNDGYMDVVLGGGRMFAGGGEGVTRIWVPATSTWKSVPFPPHFFGWVHTKKTGFFKSPCPCSFGVIDKSCFATLYVGAFPKVPGHRGEFWQFDGTAWQKAPALTRIDPAWLKKTGIDDPFDRDCDVAFRDLNGDGRCVLLYQRGTTSAVLRWSDEDQCWKPLPFSMPAPVRGVHGGAARFIDLDGDGKLDFLFSDEKAYGVYLFKDMKQGWSRKGIVGKAGEPGAVPMIAHNNDGRIENMGFFVHSGHLWWSNEGTPLLKDHVARMPLGALLQDMDIPALSPEQSLKAIKMRPGFQAELMVAEPLVKSPIAFAFGPDGRLWVVEMGDYPLGIDGKGKPGGKIKVLEDTTGTGKYDKMTVFMDNLPFPTGVLPWRNGVLVTCAPEVFYAEDTKGTGKADKKVVLLSGFFEGNQQHRVNGLYYGLDNWVYCANGDSGGIIKSHLTGKTIDIRGRDLRFKPDTGEVEAVSGQTQYGHGPDDWGNRFGGNNSNPCWHFVLDDHYIKRNPHIAVPDPRVPVPVVAGNAPVYPASKTLPRFNDFHTANRFTSACSPIIYRDDLFGPAYSGNLFLSEPVHNLVHREVVKPKGVTFTSTRAADEQTSEFLASADNWFRPTMIQTGPDGALWVADMYRFVIEHPQWIPKEWQAKLDLRAGEDKGRIYRVYPVGKKPRAIPRLDKMTIAELVACLESPNGWQRDLAQRLLVQKGDYKAVPLLEKLFRDSKNPVARLHALYTLDGLGELHPEYVKVALADEHPGVRKHAVRMIERQFNQWRFPSYRFTQMEDDADPQVRMQLAYTLGEWKDYATAGRMLGRLALRDGHDQYMLAAILSSVHKENFAATVQAFMDYADKAPSTAALEQLVRLASALGDDKGTATLLTSIGTGKGGQYTAAQFSALAAYLDALDQRKVELVKLANDKDRPELEKAVHSLKPLFKAARETVADAKAPVALKILAVRLLARGLDSHESDRKSLADLLSPQTPEELQVATVQTIGSLHGPVVPPMLLKGWKAYGPNLRARVLEVLLSGWVNPLLDALERKDILPSEVAAVYRQRLLDHKFDLVRQRATKIFAATTDVDRQKLVESYRPALEMKGDVVRGSEVFKKNCSACHQLGGIGQHVGPDLAAEAGKPGEVLLIAILDPNAAVEARYVNYVATLKNGKIVTGLIASETGGSLTLIGADGQKVVIPRSDLDELVSTGKSVMPEGLEKDIKHQDMADLIAFIRKSAPPQTRKTFEGNTPALVKANADGALNLLASNCEIYGRTLVLEKQYGNLGYWQSGDDRAVWTVEVPKAGKYTVWLDWACAKDNAGQSIALDVGESSVLTLKVPSTGGWDTYRFAKVGEVQLAAGKQTVTMRAVGELRGALIDLKGIKLVPVK
jgi:putative membrane-bound dehydrogenase-like protein